MKAQVVFRSNDAASMLTTEGYTNAIERRKRICIALGIHRGGYCLLCRFVILMQRQISSPREECEIIMVTLYGQWRA